MSGSAEEPPDTDNVAVRVSDDRLGPRVWGVDVPPIAVGDVREEDWGTMMAPPPSVCCSWRFSLMVVGCLGGQSGRCVIPTAHFSVVVTGREYDLGRVLAVVVGDRIDDAEIEEDG